MSEPIIIRLITANGVEPAFDEDNIGVSRVPCRDETVQWKDAEWFVADVVTDLDGGEIIVVLRNYDQA